MATLHCGRYLKQEIHAQLYSLILEAPLAKTLKGLFLLRFNEVGTEFQSQIRI